MSEHNNSIKLALWKSLRIESVLSRFDLVIFVKTNIRKDFKFSRVASFRHVLFNDFISQLWRIYMFSFNDESNYRDVTNSLDRDIREDYKRLNFVVLSSNESTIDNISRMNELRQLVNLDSKRIWNCKETIYVLLIATFYFELSDILSQLLEDCVRCLEMIWCRLLEEVIMKLLKQLHSSRLFFTTYSSTLEHYHDKHELCSSCRWY